MTILEIDYPQELLREADQTKETLEALARESLLVRLYDLGQLSAGRAAELLAMSRREFLDVLGHYRVSEFDKAARCAALQRGLPVIGTLAVLLASKQIGLLAEVAPVINAMLAQGRRFNPQLREQVLQLASEML